MNFSRQTVFALQRHYLGTLSTPARTWVEPLPAVRLAFAGSAIRSDTEGCFLDFGTVDSSAGERRTLHVLQPGRPAAIRVAEAPEWLRAEWSYGESGTALAVEVLEDGLGERWGTLTLWVRDELGVRSESLRVRISVAPRHPIATIVFNGSTSLHPHDFGTDGADYTIAVANRTSVPLVVTLMDLPEWLELVVDDCSRRGPIAGRFFERTAPFRIILRPWLLGRRSGTLRMQTNDPRPELHAIELQFTAFVAPSHPHLRVGSHVPLELLPSRALPTQVLLENWGRSPAQVTCTSRAACVSAARRTTVPGVRDGQPGTAAVPIRIQPAQLPPGRHTFMLDLHVDNGEPSDIRVPLHATVAPRPRRELRPEMIAALFALLLLTVVLVVAARGLP